MKALVTGGGGFLGRAIVQRLVARGDTVRFVARQRYPEVEALGAEGTQTDICDLAAMERAARGMDAVFHTAALPGIWGDRRIYHAINVTGTQNVLSACKKCGVPKLIYTSSPSVVFAMHEECGIDETTPYPKKFFNPYSQTKAMAEQLVLRRVPYPEPGTLNPEPDLLTCSLRPHLIYGPGDHHLIPRLLDRARRGKLRIVGDGTNRVDLTYIDNAAHAHILACDAMTATRVNGQAYFISDGQPVVLWDWINALLKRLGIPEVRKRISASAAYALGACLEKIWLRALTCQLGEPPMTRFLAKTLSCSHYYNIEKAKRDFGYAPIVSNEDGVGRTVEYFSQKARR